MSTIKIEFPADDKVAAAAFSTALATIAGTEAPDLEARPHQQVNEAMRTAATESGEAVSDVPPEPPKSEETPPASPGSTSSPTGAAQSAESVATTSTASESASVDDTPRDTKGVPFNADYCAVAKDPFNSTGKRAGQWKKKRGLSEADYDTWYAGELANATPAAPAGSGEETVPPVNTAAAFGGPAGGAPAPSLFDVPKDTGSFMAWVSEKQAAGALTQEQVNQAFTTAGLSMADLFGEKTPEELAANIAAVYNVLAAQV